MQKSLLKLLAMPAGWDTYGASPLKWDAGMFALEVLHTLIRPRTPFPQLVPSSTGGVQLEWHEKDIDLEIHITGPYQCEVWFQDHRSGNQLADELTNDLSPLKGPIDLLTTR